MIYKVLVKKPEIYKEVVVNDYGEESTVERVRWHEEWERVEREMTAEEIAEMEAQQAEMSEPQISDDEAVAIITDTLTDSEALNIITGGNRRNGSATGRNAGAGTHAGGTAFNVGERFCEVAHGGIQKW